MQTLNKITLFPLEASVCWGWRGRASSGFAALPYHVPAMGPCVFTLCLIFSICIMGKRAPTSQVVMGINEDTISGPKGTFNHISYKSPWRHNPVSCDYIPSTWHIATIWWVLPTEQMKNAKLEARSPADSSPGKQFLTKTKKLKPSLRFCFLLEAH